MVLLDTNILIRWTLVTSSQHAVVAATVESLVRDGEICCACGQNLVELWAVLTRPTAANGFGMEPIAARARIDALRAAMPIVADPADVLDRWLDLCTRHGVRGRQVYDARLVAVMLGAGIRRLVTLNPVDFSRYGEIEVIVPG
jgi:predicted nucleic acid-binding protein